MSRAESQRTDRWSWRVGLVVLVCCLPACRPADPLTRGVWIATDSEDVLVLRIEHPRGLLSGTVHQLRGGRQVWQSGFAGTRTSVGGLQLRWGRTLFVGVPDLEVGELSGRLTEPDGSERNVLFRQGSAETVAGLAALPELPYRLRSPAPGSHWTGSLRGGLPAADRARPG